MDTAKNQRLKKIKDLPKEVELILAEDESEEEKSTENQEIMQQRRTRAGVKQDINKNADTMEKNKLLPNTPSVNVTQAQAHKTPRRTERKSVRPVLDNEYNIAKSAVTVEKKEKALAELLNTPSTATKQVLAQETQRRSARKIVRPVLDYDDIIYKKTFSSEEVGGANDTTIEEHSLRWNPAEVGRISSCRSRKSKRITIKTEVKELPEQEVSEEMQCFPECNPIHGENLITQKADLASKFEVPLETKMETQKELNKTAIDVKTDTQIVENQKYESKEVRMEDIQDNNKPTNVDTEEHFGKYLKANVFDLSDIGVQPLDLDECDSGKDQQHEMSSLLVSDDMDELEKKNDNKNKLNVTFETNENTSVVVSSNEGISEIEDNCENTKSEESHSTVDDEPMQILQLTDDDDENIEPTINESKKDHLKIVLTDTNNHNLTLMKCELDQSTTPKAKRSKPYRFPTPYKARISYNFTNDTTATVGTSSIEQLNVNTSPIMDIVKCKTRKRSKSATTNAARSDRSVKFYSPANTTMGIDEMDTIISIKHAQSKTHDKRNVTQRRKRSISLDENRLIKSQLPKPIAIKPPVQSAYTRTKLPNFTAIHKKTFGQMENLVDHIQRKAERAKILTNSAGKLRTAALSIQKQHTVKRLNTDKPKAVKKIDLAPSAIPRPQQQLSKTAVPLKQNKSQGVSNKLINNKVVPRSNAASVSKLKPLGDLKITQALSKPAFNLSTMLTPVNKLAERRQRHMDMFKGRPTAKGDGKQEIIRGVRSNRRFELQMQHRRNIEEH